MKNKISNIKIWPTHKEKSNGFVALARFTFGKITVPFVGIAEPTEGCYELDYFMYKFPLEGISGSPFPTDDKEIVDIAEEAVISQYKKLYPNRESDLKCLDCSKCT